MMKYTVLNTVIIGAVLVAFGCRSYRHPEVSGIQADLQDRISFRDDWSVADNSGTDAAGTAVDSILAGELTPDKAVKIGLLNNPSLRAVYEDLGVSQGDLMAARSFPNPVFDFHAVESHEDDFGISNANDFQYSWSIAVNLVEWVARGSSRRIAENRMQQTKLDLTHAVIELIRDIRNAVFAFKMESAKRALMQEISAGEHAAIELYIEQFRVGNINELALANAKTHYQESKIRLAEQRRRVMESREHINRLLGLWGDEINWTMSYEFPDMPDEDLVDDGIEAVVLTRNISLAKAKAEIDILTDRIKQKNVNILSHVNIGFLRENEDFAEPSNGILLGFEIPIFEQNRGQVQGLIAAIRKTGTEAEAVAVGLRSQLRMARSLYGEAVDKVRYYETSILPNYAQIVQLSQQHYNAMFIGVYELLDIKKNELQARMDYFAAVNNYWQKRTDLQHMLAGGHIGGAKISATDSSAPVEESGGGHH